MEEFKLDLTGLEPINKAPYPFLPIQLEWLEALESGKYAQGEGYLQTKADKFCCLGVAAVIAGCQKKIGLGQTDWAYSFKMPEESDLGWARGALPYGARIKFGLLSDIGAFARPVKFPGLRYGDGAFSSLTEPTVAMETLAIGHASLVSMNDCRMLPNGKGDFRPFSFPEIAQYIRHDPWNVFLPPEKIALDTASPPPISGGG